MTHLYKVLAGAALLGIFGMAVFVSTASADHSWGNYHWARTANPFTLKLGDNVSSTWDFYLTQASNDWTLSSVLNTQVVAGVAGRNCRATYGRAEICNAKYGANGWLGIASIWASGNHIVQGTVKMNDTYFNTTTYNKPAWRALVMCQEIGHIFGLGHQDESFANTSLGTCMDYTSDPTSNQHPDAHDYAMLETIYAHLDTTTTVSQSTSSLKGRAALEEEFGNDPTTWGKEISRSADGRVSLFEKDFGNGDKKFTHVFWVSPRPGANRE